jgi:3-methylcrotonyl-CoA carboxylase alpha subunit
MTSSSLPCKLLQQRFSRKPLSTSSCLRGLQLCRLPRHGQHSLLADSVEIVAFQTDAGNADTETEPETLTVHVQTPEPGVYDIRVGETSFTNVKASISDNKLSVNLNGQALNNTVVLQRAPPGMPPTSSASSQDRCHVFHAGTRSTLILPAPKWLKALGAGVLRARGALRAPMPSLVVEVKVAVGDKVEKGQAVVVLESMKTETVLRAPAAGVIKAVGCSKGEMVEEGRELVDIDDEAGET